jgi:DNA-binding transcriptional MocR family regulator
LLKYQLIVEHIKNEIRNGNLKPQKKLPSLREVSDKFGCSVGTVLAAYNELEKEHIVFSKAKSGYYILDSGISRGIETESALIDFSSGAPDMGTLPYKDFQHCLNNAIELYKETLFSYCDPQGLASLIRVMEDHLKDYQIFAKPENIIITTGSQQALSLLSAMPFPNGNSNVLLEQPTYYGIIKSLELNNIPAVGIERGLNGLDLNELEKLFKYGSIKFFYTIPRFHNPTGNSYSRSEREAIVKMAEKYNVYIVEDDIMADLDPNKKYDPMYSYDKSSKVIYLKSYSKILMPGLRIAAMAMPKILINTFLDYKKWSDMNSPILSQGALEIYLKSGMFGKHRKNISKLYSERMSCLKALTEGLKHPEIKWSVPDSGYFACMYVDKGIHYERIINSLHNANIRMLDTSTCFLKEYRTDRYFRISVSKADEAKISKGIPAVFNAAINNLHEDSFFEESFPMI